jgi:hypothetical protein
MSFKLNKKTLKKKSFDFYIDKNNKKIKFLNYRQKFFLFFFLNKYFQNKDYYKF